MFAKQQVAALMAVKDQLDKAGISLVAVGSGSPDQAQDFVAKFAFTAEIYVSMDLAAYRAFKLVRGIGRTLGPASILRGIGAIKNGFRQSSTAGDHWQQGGIFLIGPGDRLLFEHRDQFAGDHADLDQILALIK
ncbi:MAG: AhpC/TSA family protein [Desulfobacterales bacterium]|nr:AhpC/TSA family protein [Desulfobacterales bacterium]